MLRAKAMSPDLRADYDTGQIKTDEELYVRDDEVDSGRNRILLLEADEPTTDGAHAELPEEPVHAA